MASNFVEAAGSFMGRQGAGQRGCFWRAGALAGHPHGCSRDSHRCRRVALACLSISANGLANGRPAPRVGTSVGRRSAAQCIDSGL